MSTPGSSPVDEGVPAPSDRFRSWRAWSRRMPVAPFSNGSVSTTVKPALSGSSSDTQRFCSSQNLHLHLQVGDRKVGRIAQESHGSGGFVPVPQCSAALTELVGFGTGIPYSCWSSEACSTLSSDDKLMLHHRAGAEFAHLHLDEPAQVAGATGRCLHLRKPKKSSPFHLTTMPGRSCVAEISKGKTSVAEHNRCCARKIGKNRGRQECPTFFRLIFLGVPIWQVSIVPTTKNLFLRLKALKDTSAQDLIEYALMAGFVAVAAGAVMPGVASSISTIFSKVGSVLAVASTQSS